MFLDLFLSFKNIVFNKYVILVNTSFQFINFIEYKKKNFSNEKKLNNKVIHLVNVNEKDYLNILYLNKTLNNNENRVVKIRGKISIVFLMFFLKIKVFFKLKFNEIIIGDYNNFIFKLFYKFSDEKVILDDGNNMLLFNKIFKLSRKNLTIFSLYNPGLLKHKRTIRNNLLCLKKKFKSQKKINEVLILGYSFIEKGLMTKDEYISYLSKIKKKFKNFKISYYKHPKTSIDHFKSSFLPTVNSELPIEVYFMKRKNYPKYIVGFNTTAFITLSEIYKKKIKFYNVDYKLKINNNFDHYQKMKRFDIQIKKYLKSNKNIVFISP